MSFDHFSIHVDDKVRNENYVLIFGVVFRCVYGIRIPLCLWIWKKSLIVLGRAEIINYQISPNNMKVKKGFGERVDL